MSEGAAPPPVREPRPDAAGAPASGSRAEDFDAFYRSATPPWDIGRPQPAFADVARTGGLGERVLDAGCGTGEHALLAATTGAHTVGIDAAPTAIERARAKAAAQGLAVTFVVGDALALDALGEQFDTVLDCGLFHIFDDDDRPRYVASLAGALRPGGRAYILCFSDEQPGDWGPRRVTRAELEAAFTPGWRVLSIEASRLELTEDLGSAKGWLATVERC
jgi:SAM-dependent methyltransferase